MLLDLRSLWEGAAAPVVVETGSAAFPFVSPRLRRRPNIVPREHPPLREIERIRRILPIAAEALAAIPNDDPEVIIALYAMGEINESEMAALLAA